MKTGSSTRCLTVFRNDCCTSGLLTPDGPKPAPSMGIMGASVRRRLDPRQMWKKTLEVTVSASIKGGEEPPLDAAWRPLGRIGGT